MSRHQFTSRTKARKRAADVVFEADQRGMGSDPRVLSDLLRERKVLTAALTPLPDYSVRIVEGVAANLRRIDELIATHAKVPGLDRIPAVDLAVLRVAVWEMLGNREDVPPLVAIDEAISIVKSISTDTSPGFVNAVLDAVRSEVDSPAWRRRRVLDEGAESASPSAPADVSAPGPAATPIPAAEPGTAPATPDGGSVQAAGERPDHGAETGGESVTEDAPTQSVPAEPAAAASGPDPDDADDAASDGPGPRGGGEDVDRSALRSTRDGHPTLDDLTKADLDELDELLDEY